MPKSKREKIVHLTKTKKKGKEHKNALVSKIQECVDKFERIFVLSAKNLQNSLMKEIRDEWLHSRLFFAKNSVMGHALGCNRDSEYKRNLHKISLRLHGPAGLLFTNSTEDEVLKWFEDFNRETFATAGDIAPKSIRIKAGELKTFQHTMEEQLRGLGMQTQLNAGVITLLKDYPVCRKGQPVTAKQAKILKLFGHKLFTFKAVVECMWSNDKYKAYTVSEEPTTDESRKSKIKEKESSANEEDSDEDFDKEEDMAVNESDDDDDDEDDE